MVEMIEDIDPARLRARLEEVHAVAGPDVEVLVAGKYVPLQLMGALAEAGVELIGENRLPDLQAKVERWGDTFTWDFIGNLQSRKVRDVLPLVRLIHSVGTESVAKRLAQYGGADTEVLVQVNVAGEEGKGRGGAGGARRLHRRVARPGQRPIDDAAVHRGPGGVEAALRAPGRARGGARSRPPLDGDDPGLARGGGGGGDDDPPGQRLAALNAMVRKSGPTS